MKKLNNLEERKIKNIVFIVRRSRAITMGYKGSASLVRVSLPVDLDKLSTAARKLAESVVTLENNDDLSIVRIEGPTQRELFIKAGRSNELEEAEQFCGEGFLDEPSVFQWAWDCLRRNETPEEYFERHARMIENVGGHQIVQKKGNYVAKTW